MFKAIRRQFRLWKDRMKLKKILRGKQYDLVRLFVESNRLSEFDENLLMGNGYVIANKYLIKSQAGFGNHSTIVIFDSGMMLDNMLNKYTFITNDFVIRDFLDCEYKLYVLDRINDDSPTLNIDLDRTCLGNVSSVNKKMTSYLLECGVEDMYDVYR